MYKFCLFGAVYCIFVQVVSTLCSTHLQCGLSCANCYSSCKIYHEFIAYVCIQKFIFSTFIKGLVKDDSKTLEEIKLTSGAKVMVVGSTIKDIEKVKTPTTQELRAEAKAEGIIHYVCHNN